MFLNMVDMITVPYSRQDFFMSSIFGIQTKVFIMHALSDAVFFCFFLPKIDQKKYFLSNAKEKEKKTIGQFPHTPLSLVTGSRDKPFVTLSWSRDERFAF